VINSDRFEEAVEAARTLLEDVTGLELDEHGADTPSRFVLMLDELTTQPDIKWKAFKNNGMDEMVVIRNIPFVSLCNHHVVPFIGKCDIGYVPDQWIAGLSKFARVVKHFSHKLQIQENLTQEIATYLEEALEPRGVAVVMEAEHLCMTIRGAQAPGTRTYTAVMRGVFNDHTRTAKAEFLARLNGGYQ
jgi:GTP cyclohydrolase IA